MTVNVKDIVVGARIRVKHHAHKDTRPLFGVWYPGKQMSNLAGYCPIGEEFEIIAGPRRGGKPIYSYPECSGKFVALRHLSSGEIVETFYVNVRFDAELLK